MGNLADDLCSPDAYSSPRPQKVERIETHISWIFLTDDEAYKVKRPVGFAFLDFRTLEARERACRDEVELNTRLAPGVYRAVVPVRRAPDGSHHIGPGPGEVVDFAVRMTRLTRDLRADLLLADGDLHGGDVDRLAAHLAAFHLAARHDPAVARHGTLEAVRRAVDENFVETRATICTYLTAAQARELEDWQHTFLARNGGLFGDRIAAGRIREGHGDLRLEHVYVDDGHFTILDCVEFSERLRCADVASDVAFLAMDLAWHRRVDLAERFLARYARDADDYDLYALVDFYASYRAHVRAKIAATVAAAPGLEVSDDVRARAARDARRYFLLALAGDRRSLLEPAVVAVGGVIASGKSHFADALGRELGAPVLEADRTRKAMFGVSPQSPLHEAPWAGAYSPEATKRVYEEVLRRAAVVLRSGRPVVLDASFRSRDLRGAARALASAHRVPFRFVETRAPGNVLRERLAQRAHAASVSDGRLDVLDAFLSSYESVDELPAAEHATIDTTQPVEKNLAALRERIVTWPRGLSA